VATDKSQNQEWPFAEVSGCASSPVVKQAWRVVCGGARACIPCALARRALCVAATTTSSFFSTGAARCAPPPRLPPPSPPPPRRSARRRSACAARAAHTCPLPMALTGCGMLLSARGFRQLGWRVTSGKFRTGLLPQFEHQPRAQLFCMFGPLIGATVRVPHTSLYATVCYCILLYSL
jgi:hypothetical protein